MSILKILPDFRSGGGAQMALDTGLLETVDEVIARRYTWAPPALSIGKFQELQIVPRPAVRGGAPPQRRAGGAARRGVRVVDPPSRSRPGCRAAVRGRRSTSAGRTAWWPPRSPPALEALGVQLDGGRAEPYHRSALWFATSLRHDLLARGEKLVAVAQARAGGRVLVHGSVLERRPPDELVRAAETLLGEPWQGDGLAGAGYVLAAEMATSGSECS